MSAMKAQCPGCGKLLFATSTTVFQLRLKRHAKGCEPLRVFAKANAVEALRERKQAKGERR